MRAKTGFYGFRNQWSRVFPKVRRSSVTLQPCNWTQSDASANETFHSRHLSIERVPRKQDHSRHRSASVPMAFGCIISHRPFMTHYLDYLSLGLYAASFLCYARVLYVPNVWIGRIATVFLAGGILFQYYALLNRSHWMH